MNKQLINKYKPELDHWLNGGSVLINSDLGWCPIANEFAWDYNISVDALLVINDEFVEFRKALAEGKVIEYLGQSSNPWHEVQEPDFILHPTYYRIKPDEPKFKVGDFVRYIHHSHNTSTLQIDNINCDRYHFVNSGMACLEHELIPWEPIKGEWCWFFDNTSKEYSNLSQFKEMTKTNFITTTDTPWIFCEPFLNCKPSYLKDK